MAKKKRFRKMRFTSKFQEVQFLRDRSTTLVVAMLEVVLATLNSDLLSNAWPCCTRLPKADCVELAESTFTKVDWCGPCILWRLVEESATILTRVRDELLPQEKN